MTPEFEWDDDKAEINWREHGVAFNEAIKSFRDPFAVERLDDREDYGEERINLIGMCDGVVIHVTYYGAWRTNSNHFGPKGGKT